MPVLRPLARRCFLRGGGPAAPPSPPSPPSPELIFYQKTPGVLACNRPARHLRLQIRPSCNSFAFLKVAGSSLYIETVHLTVAFRADPIPQACHPAPRRLCPRRARHPRAEPARHSSLTCARTYATQMNDMPLDLSQSVSQVQRQRPPCTPLAPHPARPPFRPTRSRALIVPAAQTRPAPLHLQPCGASLCAYRVIEPRESLFHPGALR